MTEENIVCDPENEICEACGVSAEMGYVIGAGDEVAEVSLFGDSKELLEKEFAKYVALAKEVSDSVRCQVDDITDETKEVHAKFEFEVSAEKLIFELKSRSLSR